MRKSVVVSLLLMVLATSCNHFYREYDKASFPDYGWKSGQEVRFSPTITDIKKVYTLTVGVRHVYGLQLNTLAISVKIIAPSGKSTTKDYSINLRDSGGEYLGDCAGDMCDVEDLAENSLSFKEAGQYTIIITHRVQAEKVPGIMELGIILDQQD